MVQRLQTVSREAEPHRQPYSYFVSGRFAKRRAGRIGAYRDSIGGHRPASMVSSRVCSSTPWTHPWTVGMRWVASWMLSQRYLHGTAAAVSRASSFSLRFLFRAPATSGTAGDEGVAFATRESSAASPAGNEFRTFLPASVCPSTRRDASAGKLTALPCESSPSELNRLDRCWLIGVREGAQQRRDSALSSAASRWHQAASGSGSRSRSWRLFAVCHALLCPLPAEAQQAAGLEAGEVDGLAALHDPPLLASATSTPSATYRRTHLGHGGSCDE